jgi:hypothetical protein
MESNSHNETNRRMGAMIHVAGVPVKCGRDNFPKPNGISGLPKFPKFLNAPASATVRWYTLEADVAAFPG